MQLIKTLFSEQINSNLQHSRYFLNEGNRGSRCGQNAWRHMLDPARAYNMVHTQAGHLDCNISNNFYNMISYEFNIKNYVETINNFKDSKANQKGGCWIPKNLQFTVNKNNRQTQDS